jgi:hypothetical protein
MWYIATASNLEHHLDAGGCRSRHGRCYRARTATATAAVVAAVAPVHSTLFEGAPRACG